MGIWFRANENKKYHLACYGGGIAQCGHNVKITACYATDKIEITVDEGIAQKRKDLCQACINSVLRFRQYTIEKERELGITK